MIDQLRIGNRYSFDDFEASVKERKINPPNKKVIKDTVPFSNMVYDFSKINGEIYWEERELEYVFEIVAGTPEELEEKKQPFINWIMNVMNEDIYDIFVRGYHFSGTFDSISVDDSEIEKSTITVKFTAYPYMIADDGKKYSVPLYAYEKASLKVNNDSSHRITPTINTTVPVVIKMDSSSYGIPQGETTDDSFNFKVGESQFEITNSELIKETFTSSPMENTIAAIVEFNHIGGVSEQNTEPTPTNPVPIKNAFDCVEMMQGVYLDSNGIFSASDKGICSKSSIPCNSGDIIKVDADMYESLRVSCYNNGNFIRSLNANKPNNEFTIPSGVTEFRLNIFEYTNGITPSTVGKVKLTINGQYVAIIKTVGKNFFSGGSFTKTTKNECTITPILDENGRIIGASANGTPTANAGVTIGNVTLPKGTYIMSGGKASAKRLYTLIGSTYYNDLGSGVQFELTEDTTISIAMTIVSGTSVANEEFYPMIRKADITDDTYEPYQESLARVLLNEPLRQDDVMGRTEVVRKRMRFVFDGSESAWQASSSVSGRYFITTGGLLKPNTKNGVCTQATFFTETSAQNYCYITASSQFVINTGFATLDEWKAHLQENPIIVECELTEPTTETLDTESQIALNSLETFDGATSISFDSVVQPTFEAVCAITPEEPVQVGTFEVSFTEEVF